MEDVLPNSMKSSLKGHCMYFLLTKCTRSNSHSVEQNVYGKVEIGERKDNTVCSLCSPFIKIFFIS